MKFVRPCGITIIPFIWENLLYMDKTPDPISVFVMTDNTVKFTAMAAKKELHKMILYHREQAKMSREQLAELAGVGKTVIYDLEKGKQTGKWSTIMSILHALNIDIKFQSPLMEAYEKSDHQNT